MPYMAGPDGAWESDDDAPLYVISVAAELTGLHAQTLRQYDRLGLVSPGRSPGGGRRYSRSDIGMLREVVRLSSFGLGLEGIRAVLELENRITTLQRHNRELQAEIEALRAERDERSRTALVVWRPERRPQRPRRPHSPRTID
ncbi:MAG: MerR family transcriptional regulator [Sporichthyaceae bacterium]|nr:MerR family transcriptional regulator [Sporichthyaceae bacterium]